MKSNSMWKKGISVTLSGAMLCGLMFTSAFADTTKTDSVQNLLKDGKSVTSGTYKIYDQDDMDAFVTYVNTEGNNTEGVTFVIDGTGKTYTVDTVIAPVTLGAADTNSPYVTDGTGFEGTFNGGNNTVELALKDSSTATGVGLFGYLAPKGTVENLTVTGSVVGSAGTSNENNILGAVVAYNSGTIDNVTNEATVTGNTVYNVGGIAGFNDNYYMAGAVGIIENCTNNGAVTGLEKVGGIVGENAGTIAACGNGEKAIITMKAERRGGVGGIAGRNGNNNTAIETGTIVSCWNRGEVNLGNGSWAGGIAGFQNEKSSISYSYSAGTLVTTAKEFVDTGYIVGNDSGKVTTCYALDQGYTDLVSDGATVTNADEIKDAVSILNGCGTANGTWKLITEADIEAGKYEDDNDGYPVVSGADVTTKPADGWKDNTATVYLDGTGATKGAYTTLDDAVAAANGGTVIVVGTVTISEGASYYDSVEIKRGAGFSGPMFVIDAPDNSYGTAYVTMTSAKIDGGGYGTVFQVLQGRLRLRGGITVQNCDIGVIVSGSGQVEINYATLSANQYSVMIMNAAAAGTDNFIWSDFGSETAPDVKVSGMVYLGIGATIAAESAIYSPLTVQCVEFVLENSPITVIVPATGVKLTANMAVPGGLSSLLYSSDIDSSGNLVFDNTLSSLLGIG